MRSTQTLTRSQAVALIDDLREKVYAAVAAQERAGRDLSPQLSDMVTILDNAGLGLTPCHGEAHEPHVGGNIDNCMACAPKWGWVGDEIRIT